MAKINLDPSTYPPDIPTPEEFAAAQRGMSKTAHRLLTEMGVDPWGFRQEAEDHWHERWLIDPTCNGASFKLGDHMFTFLWTGGKGVGLPLRAELVVDDPDIKMEEGD